MWDRQPQSWWHQTTGDAIVGELTRMILSLIPIQILSWTVFRDPFPEGLLLTRDTGFEFVYDSPPYGEYDVLVSKEIVRGVFGEGGIQPRNRVASVIVDGRSVAYPFSLLQEHPVINSTVDGRAIIIFFVGGPPSPFPKQVDPIAFSDIGSLTTLAKQSALSFRTVGSTAIFSPTVNGRSLTFEAREGEIVDLETGSRWDVLGRAVVGSLEGVRIAPVVTRERLLVCSGGFPPGHRGPHCRRHRSIRLEQVNWSTDLSALTKSGPARPTPLQILLRPDSSDPVLACRRDDGVWVVARCHS